MMSVARLSAALAAVAPIKGVSVGVVSDKATWRVEFEPSATVGQKAAAQNVINNFDVNADDIRIAALLADASVQTLKNQLVTSTPAQISAYVDAQVPELSAAARTLLKKMLVLQALALSS